MKHDVALIKLLREQILCPMDYDKQGHLSLFKATEIADKITKAKEDNKITP